MTAYSSEDAATLAVHLAAETLALLRNKGIITDADARSVIDATKVHAATSIGEQKASEMLDILYKVR